MAKWIFTRTGAWDYPTLGFTATSGDVIEADLAPDAWWDETDAGAVVTIPVVPAGGVEEPAGDSLLAYNAVTNRGEWKSLATLGLDEATLSSTIEAAIAGLGSGTVQAVTLTGAAQAITLPESPATGEVLTLILTQDGEGGRTAAWTGVEWDGGITPTLSTGAGERDVITLLYTGADWLGFVSGAFAAYVAPDATAPTAPTGLTATAASSTSVNLSWSASTDNVAVTGYEYRVDGGTAVDAGAGTAETVTGLTAETEYDFEVRAYDAAGNRSDWSAVATETTDAGSTILAADDYTRSDGALGTTPTGALAWGSYSTNAFTITSNEAKNNLGAGQNALSFVNVGQADHKVSAKIAYTSVASGVALRASADGTQFYRVVHLSGTWYIIAHTAWGTALTLDSWAQATSTGDIITAQAVTNGAAVDFIVWRNGTQVRTYSDSTHAFTGTRAGIWGVVNARLDDFEVSTP